MSYFPSRSEEFNTGRTGSSDVATSLTTDAANYNAKTKASVADPFSPGLTPHSVLQPIMKSANGFGQLDASRITPMGLLPSRNANSRQTYNIQNPQYGTHYQY